jgi:hypothetical protein
LDEYQAIVRATTGQGGVLQGIQLNLPSFADSDLPHGEPVSVDQE